MPRHCGHCLARRAGRGARPLAGVAAFFARNLDRRLGAREGLVEGDLEIEAQIGPARRAAAPAASAAEPEEVAEDVGEVREDVRVEAGPARSTGARHAGVAEAVVPRALVGVAQDGVGLGGLLELLFGGRVALIAIGVVLQRQLAIRALDVLLAGILRDAEDLVVVPLAHALATFTSAGRSRRCPMR